jgi:phosphoribosylanthranilate isomerase
MIVQIYEIQSPAEAETCIELGVDHVGSILPSREEWHAPALIEVIRLSKASGAKNSLIPLFKDLETLFRALDCYAPDYLHLCDSLTDRSGRELDLGPAIRLQGEVKHRFPEVRIMRSIPVPRKGEVRELPCLRLARRLEPFSDLFLTDTWTGEAPVEGYIGITGERADPALARQLVCQSDIPVILAGGLSPENVYAALMEVGPAGADSCTLTNQVDAGGNPVRFRKDFDRVGRFVAEVRRAERAMAAQGAGGPVPPP